LLVLAGIGRFLPPFYLPGAGPTMAGQATLGAATAIFALSAALMFVVFTSAKSKVLYWYSLALGATAAGLLGVIFSSGGPGALAMWAGWGALYLSGVFLIKSVLSAERLEDLPMVAGGKPR